MITLEKQNNYAVAFERGLENARHQSPDHLWSLGAAPVGVDRYVLPVLNAKFEIDLQQGTVVHVNDEPNSTLRLPVATAWQILAVHYLGAHVAWPRATAWVSFADLPDARGYQSVYQGRVINRFCRTAGRHRDLFAAASEGVGGKRVNWGDEGYQFAVFPRVHVGVVWYASDGELPVSASFLYQDNILSFLPSEDVIVLSESLVGRLQGKEW